MHAVFYKYASSSVEHPLVDKHDKAYPPASGEINIW